MLENDAGVRSYCFRDFDVPDRFLPPPFPHTESRGWLIINYSQMGVTSETVQVKHCPALPFSIALPPAILLRKVRGSQQVIQALRIL